MSTDIKFNPVELEKKHVHEIYDSIAEAFSASRHSPWSGVMKFLQSLPPGAFGADIGCGNGKYLVAVDKEKLPLAPLLASDSSVKLLDLVRKRGFDAVAVNILALPYRPESLDYFICVAVLHHLSTPERRLKGIISMAELLKTGGLGLIQVWAKDQIWKGQPSTYVKKRDHEVNVLDVKIIPDGGVLPVQKPRTPFVAPDILLPWKATTKKDEMLVRYYHVFEEGELEKLISLEPSLRLIECVYIQGNWLAIVQKIESKP